MIKILMAEPEMQIMLLTHILPYIFAFLGSRNAESPKEWKRFFIIWALTATFIQITVTIYFMNAASNLDKTYPGAGAVYGMLVPLLMWLPFIFQAVTFAIVAIFAQAKTNNVKFSQKIDPSLIYKYIRQQKIDIIIITSVNTIFLIQAFLAPLLLISQLIIYILLWFMWLSYEKGTTTSGVIQIIIAIYLPSITNFLLWILSVFLIINANRYIQAIKYTNNPR